MNIPGITKALELDDEDWQLAVKLRGLSEHQREQFSAALGPTKPQKKPGKKGARAETERTFKRCDICGLTKRADVHKDADAGGYHEFREKKSQRASGMAAAISNSLESSRKATAGDDDGLVLCQHRFDGGGMCKRPADHNIHHLKTDSLYHEFVAGKSDAQSAAGGL